MGSLVQPAGGQEERLPSADEWRALAEPAPAQHREPKGSVGKWMRHARQQAQQAVVQDPLGIFVEPAAAAHVDEDSSEEQIAYGSLRLPEPTSRGRRAPDEEWDQEPDAEQQRRHGGNDDGQDLPAPPTPPAQPRLQVHDNAIIDIRTPGYVMAPPKPAKGAKGSKGDGKGQRRNWQQSYQWSTSSSSSHWRGGSAQWRTGSGSGRRQSERDTERGNPDDRSDRGWKREGWWEER